MNYHNITKDDMLNGSGLRVVLWVAGCAHHCPQCHNPITWNPDGGLPFTDAEKREIFRELDKDYVSGITLSGGDPLYPGNAPEVTLLAREIRQKYPNKSVWLYTGYLWEDVKDMEVVKYLDALVDGRYKPWLRDVHYKWAGSTNQRAIDVKGTLNLGRIALVE